MSVMTAQALAVMIATQHCIPQSLTPVVIGIAQRESGLDPAAVRVNANGTTDYGLGQINSSNFVFLSAALHTPVNATTIFDPCLNMRASVAVLFARYNGNAPAPVKADYAAGIMAKVAALDGAVTSVKPQEAPAPDPAAIYAKPAHAGRDLVFSR